MAAVNPVFGTLTLIFGMPVGAIFTSSVFMNISTTSAMAVAAGSALVHRYTLFFGASFTELRKYKHRYTLSYGFKS